MESAGDGDGIAEGVVGVAVVDNDEEGLAGIDTLKAAGDGGAAGDALADGLEGDVEAEGGGSGAEDIGDIDEAEQGRGNGERAGRGDEIEADTIESGADVG